VSTPVHIGDLCAADLEVRTIDGPDGLVLAIATAEHRVDLVSDCCDDQEKAAAGYERLAAQALAHAELLRLWAR
jgi:hypothetical protein